MENRLAFKPMLRISFFYVFGVSKGNFYRFFLMKFYILTYLIVLQHPLESLVIIITIFVFLFASIYHYENTPIQIYWKFHHKKKNWKFSDKNSDIFRIPAQNIDCGYLLEPPCRGGSNEYPQSMFLSRNKKKIMYTL